MYNQTDNERPNALKWTPEKAKDILNQIMLEATSPEVSSLQIALVRQGLYKEIWAYWKKIFIREGEIQEMMLRIDSIFEAKLYHAALYKEVSPWIAIFGLKYNHRWTDRMDRQPEPEPLRELKPSDGKKCLVYYELGNGEVMMACADGEGGIFKRVGPETQSPAQSEESKA